MQAGGRPGAAACSVCREAVGLDVAGREFVPCECAFPLCRPCYEYIRAAEDGRCPACKERFKRMRGQRAPRPLQSRSILVPLVSKSFLLLQPSQ